MREWIAPTRCAGCGAEHAGNPCPECLPPAVHRAAPPSPLLAGCWALTGYDAPLATAVRKAKYGADRALTRALGRALADRLAPAIPPDTFTAIVPAPSPWTRRLIRGFSPAAVLAAEVARATGVPVSHALSITPGPRQASLTGNDRRRSLVSRVRSRLPVEGRVLLVDDVATTGATADACARELLGDRASEVWLAVLCLRRPEP